jgi:hypothetical protein
VLAIHPVSLPAAPAPQLSLVDLRPLPGWKGDPVGNVVITTPEGSRLQLTKWATGQQPKALISTNTSTRGLAGWVDCSKPGVPAALNVVKGVPIGSRLVLRKPNGSLLTITSEKPIIEQWGFDPDGIHVILKSRGLHGSAMIERFTLSGVKDGSCKAYDEKAPKWAIPYLDR